MKVEVAGGRRFGMDQQASTADFGAKLRGARDHVSQQPCPEAASFVLNGNSQSSKQRDWLGIAARPFAESRRSVSEADACHAPRVESHHLRAVSWRDDEHFGCPVGVRLPGVMAQPLGLLIGSTLEPLQYIIGFQ
jgi:hypothetical protein